VVQISRFRDGSRKISHITEVAGVENGQIKTHDIYLFKPEGLGPDGKVLGGLHPTGHIPAFIEDLRANGFVISDAVFVDQPEPVAVAVSELKSRSVGRGTVLTKLPAMGGGIVEQATHVAIQEDGLLTQTIPVARL